MRTIVLRIAISALLLTNLSASASAADSMPWAADLATASQLAAQTNKLVLVHFKGDHCAPCLRLEKNVFGTPIFGHTVSQTYIPVLINATASPDIARQFAVTSWPTDVIMTPDGRELHRMISPQDPQDYMRTLGQIAWRYAQAPNSTQNMSGFANSTRAPSGMDQTSQARAADSMSRLNYQSSLPTPVTSTQNPLMPQQSPNGITTPSYAPAGRPAATDDADLSRSPFNARDSAGASPLGRQSPFNGYATENVIPTRPASVSGTASGSVTPTTTAASSRSSPPQASSPYPSGAPDMVHNRFATEGAAARATTPKHNEFNTTTQKVVQNLAKGAADTEAALLPSQTATPSSVRNPQPPVKSTPRQVAGAMPNGSPAPPSGPPGIGAGGGRHQLVTAEIPSPIQPMVGQAVADSATSEASGQTVFMDGFCCVTLMDENRWVQGDTRWGARHRGKVYLFQTAAAQQKFLAEPDKYSPALAGFDPVVYRETGMFRTGSRAHGVRYQDKMYLFANEDGLQRFWTAPWQYAESARQAMLRANDSR